jgi:hypothetical protein
LEGTDTTNIAEDTSVNKSDSLDKDLNNDTSEEN